MNDWKMDRANILRWGVDFLTILYVYNEFSQEDFPKKTAMIKTQTLENNPFYVTVACS